MGKCAGCLPRCDRREGEAVAVHRRSAGFFKAGEEGAVPGPAFSGNDKSPERTERPGFDLFAPSPGRLGEKHIDAAHGKKHFCHLRGGGPAMLSNQKQGLSRPHDVCAVQRRHGCGTVIGCARREEEFSVRSKGIACICVEGTGSIRLETLWL